MKSIAFVDLRQKNSQVRPRRFIHLDVLIDVGQPAGLILERAANLPADLVVMGTHGTSGFQHLLLGSVTEKVLRKATCPVSMVAIPWTWRCSDRRRIRSCGEPRVPCSPCGDKG